MPPSTVHGVERCEEVGGLSESENDARIACQDTSRGGTCSDY